MTNISPEALSFIESKGVHTCENCGHRGADVTEQPTHQNGHDTFAYLCNDYRKCTILTIKCSWCGEYQGTKPGYGKTGISHSICEKCLEEF